MNREASGLDTRRAGTVKMRMKMAARHGSRTRSGAGIKAVVSALALLFIGLFMALAPSVARAGQASYAYDELGRLVRAVDEQGNVTTYGYDAVGNIISITNGAGGAAAPAVTAITPASAAAGSAIAVAITGQDLTGAMVSTDNPGITVSGARATATSVTATFAIALTARTGASTVYLTTPAGAATAAFTVDVATPAITAATPATGPPSRLVTISGSGFSPTPSLNQVGFNGAAATVYSSSPTSVTTAVPDGATTGPLTVTVDGVASNAVAFTVTAAGTPPSITTISPNSGSVEGGSYVTITGTGFSADSVVYVGQSRATITTVLDTSTIKAVMPPSLAGAVDVLVTNANGDALSQGAFTYLDGPSESISNITPTMGLVNIPINAPVTVLFTRPVERASVNQTTFSLKDASGAAVAGTIAFSCNDTLVTFSPSAYLAPSSTYTLSVTQGIRSIDGVPLDSAFLGTFVTGVSADTMAPTASITPATGSTGVPYNARVLFTFNEQINPNTLNQSTVTVVNQGVVRNGTIVFGQGNMSATFVPNSPFAPSTQVTVTLSGQVADMAGNRIIGGAGVGTDLVSAFTTSTLADVMPPRVIVVSPANGKTGISTKSAISVTFSESVDPATVDMSTFLVSNGGAAVTGTVALSAFNTVATFMPSAPLPPTTTVTVSLTTGVTDLVGNAMLANFTSSFSTAAALDNVRPSVISMTPYPGQTGVAANAKVTIVFDERIDAATVTLGTFYMNGPAGTVAGSITVSPDQTSATFTPAAALTQNASYSVWYTSGIKDTAGNQLFNPNAFYFTTGSVLNDTVGPSVTAISPSVYAKGVPVNAPVLIRFSEPVAATSVNSGTVILSAGGVPVETVYTLEQNNTVARVKPANLLPLAPNTFYELTVVAPGVADPSGNPLPAAYYSAFTTGLATDTAAPTIASIFPGANAQNVPANSSVTVTFSEEIDPITVNAGTLSLWGGGIINNAYIINSAGLNLSPDRKTVTVTLSGILFANQTYYVSVGGVEDLAGNKFSNTFVQVASFRTAVAAGTNLSALPTSGTVAVNPAKLYDYQGAAGVVTISNISTNGTLVPNGTLVGVTTDPAFYKDSVGGEIIGGTTSAADPRFKFFPTLGGVITFTYAAPTPYASGTAYIQAASVDASGVPIGLIGSGTVTLSGMSTGVTVGKTVNPANLRAAAGSVGKVKVALTDGGIPLPPGVTVAVTADPVYNSASAGGVINGGVQAPDARFRLFTTVTGGLIEFTYTPPVLSAGQGGYAYIQVARVDAADNILGRIDTGYEVNYFTLNGSTGYTAPQPSVVSVSPANGQSGVGTNVAVGVEFSEPLDPATVASSTFSVTSGGSAVAGTFTLGPGAAGANSVATFTPTAQLTAGASYTVAITIGLRSAAGSPLLAASSTTFSTGASADLAGPTVTLLVPYDGATGVPTNALVQAEFSEPLNAATVTGTTFTVSSGGVNVPGRVSLTSGRGGPATVAVFTPDVYLVPNAAYSVAVGAGIKDLSGNALTAPAATSFTTGVGIDNTQPSVAAVSPAPNQTGVASNALIRLAFSEPIDPQTVNQATFWVTGPGNIPVAGSIGTVPDRMSATFTPAHPLATGTTYTVKYTAGIHDIVGNPITNQGQATFTTGPVYYSDTTGPAVVAVSPSSNAAGVPLNAQMLIRFSEPVAATSVYSGTIVLSTAGVPVGTVVSLEQGNTVARVKIADMVDLAPNTYYDLTVTTGVADVYGNALVASYVSGFTTGASGDTTAPTIVSVTPANYAANVSRTASITVVFSEPVDTLTILAGSALTLTGGGYTTNAAYPTIPMTASLAADGKTLTVTPSFPLFAQQSYAMSIYGIEDYAGNKVKSASGGWITYYFTTASAAGTNVSALPNAATVVVPSTALSADGISSVLVTVSNINRSGVIVPDGTVVAVSADPAYRADTAGGFIIGGADCAADPRFRLFTVISGAISFSYISPSLLGDGAAYIYAAATDVSGAPASSIGYGRIYLAGPAATGPVATWSVNPGSLRAAAGSYAEVSIGLAENGTPFRQGTRIAVTADPALSSSMGGVINGGIPSTDDRVRIFTADRDGAISFIYTPPVLASSLTGTTYLKVGFADAAGNVFTWFNGTAYRSDFNNYSNGIFVGLSGSGYYNYSSPQPKVVAVYPANGASGVPSNARVVAEFSHSLDPATVVSSTFNVTVGGAAVPGVLTLENGARGSDTVVTFTPSAPFSAGLACGVSITGGIKSALGSALSGSNYTTFSAVGAVDAISPSVARVVPTDGAVGVGTNAVVSVEFSEPVDAATVGASTFMVSGNGANVSGRVRLTSGPRGGNTVAVFTPDQPLAASTVHTVTLGAGITDPAGNALAAPFASSFTTAATVDEMLPSVIAVSPYNGQKDVASTAMVTLAFSKPMDPLTVNSSTFYVSVLGGTVPGSIAISPDLKAAAFTPAHPLAQNATYGVYYTNGIRDFAGNRLANPTSGSSFSSGIVYGDATGPTVIDVSPAAGRAGVPVNAAIRVRFSEPIAATSLSNGAISLSSGGVPVELVYALEQDNTVVRMKPVNLTPLSPNAYYEVSVTSGVTDVSGNPVATPFVSGFTTGASADATAPMVVSVTPVNNATGVSRNTAITVTFDEEIDPISVVSGTTIRLYRSNVTIASLPASVAVSQDRMTVTLTPTGLLFANEHYTLDMVGIEDIAGNRYGGITNTSTILSSFTTAYDPNTVLNVQPTWATVSVADASLFDFGGATTTVTVSNINRAGAISNQTVAVTVDPAFMLDSVGGQVIGGVQSAADPRFRLFTPVNGSFTFTYAAPSQLLKNGIARIQVATVDASGAPMSQIGNGSVTINTIASATMTGSANPTTILANGTGYGLVSLSFAVTGAAVAPGATIAVTAVPVYQSTSVGGVINGGATAPDDRFRLFTVPTGGVVEFTYTPPALAAGQSGTAYIQVALADGAGNVLGYIGTKSLTVSGSTGYTAPQPTLVSISPANGQSGIGTNTAIIAEFSAPMDPATVTSSTFSVSGGGVTAFPGSYTMGSGAAGPNSVITFTPSTPFYPNSVLNIWAMTGLKSASGSPLSAFANTTFSTMAYTDATGPVVALTNPSDGFAGAALNSAVSVKFTEPVDASTVNGSTFSLSVGGVNVSGRVGVTADVSGKGGVVAVFTPDQYLAPNTLYTATLGAGIKDTAGNALAAPLVFSFSTGGAADYTSPTIVAVYPPSGSVDVPVSSAVTVTFSEPIDPLSLDSSKLRVGSVNGSITFINNNTGAVFTPAGPFLAGTNYPVYLYSGVRDVAGNAVITGTYVASFSTATVAATTPPTSATVAVNPPTLYANGFVPTTVLISNIKTIGGALVPNGTKVAITVDPTVDSTSVGGAISGAAGLSPDTRFMLFDTFGAAVTAYYTPSDLVGGGLTYQNRPQETIRIYSVDADLRPVSLIGSGAVTLDGIGGVTMAGGTLNASLSSTFSIPVTLRDGAGNLVPDGTVVGMTADHIFTTSATGGTFTDGAQSAGDPRVKLFTTTNGQFTATYQRGACGTNGIVQLMTVDQAGRPTSLIAKATVTVTNCVP